MVSPIGTKASEEQCYMGTYHSTRGRTLSCSSKVAIRTGIAPDGGLFVSDELGTQQVDISSLADKSYFEIAQDVLGMLLNDYTAEEISACVDEAYRGTFASEEVTPLVKLDAAPGADAPQTYVMELFGGPTSAFKDVALQMLPRLMARTSAKDGGAERIMIVTATSGDTGKAALEGFRDVERTRILVFYPKDGVSAIQELQMVTQEGGNVGVCSVVGNFDDAQTGVKKLFSDRALAEELAGRGYFLSSANSINWGRVLPQVVYYVSAYCDLLKSGAIQAGQQVNVCVPTGNFGNILAGYYARKMGVPIKTLLCASNANNVLTDFLHTGVYDRNRAFYNTMSPSMDILISSNLERMLFEMTGGDDAAVRDYMGRLNTAGRYQVSDEVKEKLDGVFASGCCDDRETAQVIGEVWKEKGYLIDPHTAVAFGVLDKYRKGTGDNTPALVVSTASPFKFCSSVLPALGVTQLAQGTGILDQLTQVTGVEAPAPLAGLKDRKVRFQIVTEKEHMVDQVLEMLR